jgi:hypothetical protein
MEALMKRRKILALPVAALALAAGMKAVPTTAAESPEVSIYLNPN